MKVTVSKGDVIWSYLGTFFHISSNLLIIPLIVYFLTEDMLGLWYIFVSIGGIASFFDFGFSPTFARNITFCWSGVGSLENKGISENKTGVVDVVLFNRVIVTCKRIYALLSLALLLLLLTVGTYYIFYISRHISGYVHLIAWVIFVIGTFLNLYYNYIDTFLLGVGAIKEASKARLIAKGVQLGLIVILLLLGYGIIGVAFSFVMNGVVYRYIANKEFLKIEGIKELLGHKGITTSIEETKSLFKSVWYSAWREGLVQVSLYCCEQISVIICSLYLSLEETGVYSLGLQIINAVSTIAVALYTTYQPSLSNAFVNKDIDKLRQSMSIIVVSFIVLFVIGLLGTIVVGLPLLTLIKPTAVISIPVLLGISANSFTVKFRNCYSSYFSASNRLLYVPAFVYASLGCVVLSFIFIGPFGWGVWGLIAAQLISQWCYNAWYWPYKAHKEMGITLVEMFPICYTNLKTKINHVR